MSINIEEIWKAVIGYELNYEVSNRGNVRSKNRSTIDVNGIIRTYKSKKRKPVNNGRYYQVDLSINGNRKYLLIHRLVAEAFISNPDNKSEVNHKDGDKLNNNVFNLEWNTSKENSQHSFKTGLSKPTTFWKGKFGINSPLSKPVIQLDKAGNVLNRYNGTHEAERKTGVSSKSISQCCLNKRMSAGRYVWKYDVKL